MYWLGSVWDGRSSSSQRLQRFKAFGPVIFAAFGVFVAFMGHWGWTLVAFYSVSGI